MAPADDVAMLRPKSDSTRAMAASSCQGTPQPESRAARSIVARWSAVSVGTNACQSSTAPSLSAASAAADWSSDGVGVVVDVAVGDGVGVDVVAGDGVGVGD